MSPATEPASSNAVCGMANSFCPICASPVPRVFVRASHLDPPRHLSHFTPETATRLLTASGFGTPQVHFFYPELNEFGMIQTVLNRLGFSPNLLFNLLKRNRVGLPRATIGLVLHLIGASVFLVVAWPLLLLAAWGEEWWGRGGTMVLFARKPSEKGREKQ